MITPSRIEKAEAFFSSIQLPQTLQLSKCENISDLPKCVKLHISYCKANPKSAMPYFNRLLRISTILTK